MNYDLVVLGGGPAGYVGAIRASQLGKKVLVIDKERAGGTCLNWGCIPTKALIRSAESYHLLQRADEFGLSVEKASFDFKKVMARSREVANKMAKGIEFLFKSKKVDYIVGRAVIRKDKSIEVTREDGSKEEIKPTKILLATGSVPRPLPDVPVDGKRVVTSREALALSDQPASVIILGAGAIGVEFAYFFNSFGTKVTLIEMMPRILPVEDHEVSETIARSFAKDGIEILTETKAEKVEVGPQSIKVNLSGKHTRTVEAAMLLVSIGVQANLNGVLGEGLSLELDRGYVKTSETYETSVPSIYAAGDIIGPPWLAHVASHEAIEAVEGMFLKGKKPKKVTVFPGCTYCQPQVASVGLTEAKAKEKGLKFKVGKFPYRASGRAVAAGEPEGFVKILTGEPHGEILGAHIVGAEATELISELCLAITLEATIDEILATIHAHPTLAEMIAEATLASKGEAIHI
ncbi:MAG: dihydrolipoyl dehydrogenase [Candidatus Methylacidiphilales bacterium]